MSTGIIISACPSVHTERRDSHKTVFRNISYSGFLLKSVDVFRNPTETPVTFHEDPRTIV